MRRHVHIGVHASVVGYLQLCISVFLPGKNNLLYVYGPADRCTGDSGIWGTLAFFRLQRIIKN